MIFLSKKYANQILQVFCVFHHPEADSKTVRYPHFSKPITLRPCCDAGLRRESVFKIQWTGMNTDLPEVILEGATLSC